MEHRGVAITAGFDKSQSAIAIAELLKRNGIAVKGFIVVSPYSWSRLRKYVKKRGLSFIWEAIPRLLGYKKDTSGIAGAKDYLKNFWDEKEMPYKSIKKWSAENKTEYCSVKSINSQNAVKFLNEMTPKWLIYSGGGIIRNHIIKVMDGRILNAHQGPLPQVRGMNAAEWSILLGEKQAVTIHLIDRGIDTGKIITSLPYSIEKSDTINSIRDKAMIKGIEGLVEVASKKGLAEYNLKENSSNYRQCYILSSAMKELLNKKLDFIQKELI